MTTVVTPWKCWAPRCAALEALDQVTADADEGGEPGRIDLLDAGGEEQVGAGLGGQGGVAALVARVLVQVRRSR